jgi:hypothetical protein
MLEDIKECQKELNVYYDMQKICTFDYLEYCRWTDEVKYRKTLLGKITYYLGKVVAITYITRLFFSTKNLVYPSQY